MYYSLYRAWCTQSKRDCTVNINSCGLGRGPIRNKWIDVMPIMFATYLYIHVLVTRKWLQNLNIDSTEIETPVCPQIN